MINSLKSSIFDPAHVFYGFGGLPVGGMASVSLDFAASRNETLVSVQNKVHSYARHAGKKYRTKTIGDSLHIERVK